MSERTMSSTVSARTSYRGVCLILLLVVNHASSGETSGILANLYKKAAHEHRPLILVLDNSHATNAHVDRNSMGRDVMPRPASSDYNEEATGGLPRTVLLKLLDHFQNYKIRPSQNRASELPLTKTLKYKQKDSRDDRDDRDDRHKDRDERIKRYREKLSRLSDATSLRSSLRSSVVKNLLRYSNDLNCEAKNECQDDCSAVKNKKKCKATCEVKFDCNEEEEDPCADGDCDASNSCGDDGCDDEGFSTKGERLVTETPKCKRC